MMRCDRARSLFDAAWEDELSLAEREAVETHVQGCSPCRRDYDELARTLEWVAELPRPVVSVDFAQRVLAEAHRREAEVAGPAGVAGWWSRLAGRRDDAVGDFAWGARPALAAAAVLVIAVGTAFLVQGPLRTGPSDRDVAAVGTPSEAPAAASLTAPPAVSPPAPETVARVEPTSPTASAGAPASRRSRPARSVATGDLVARTASDEGEGTVVPDSLFDHTADIEFLLDPVTLKRERGRGYTPVTTPVRGQPASITF